jgi:hypothetical protein
MERNLFLCMEKYTGKDIFFQKNRLPIPKNYIDLWNNIPSDIKQLLYYTEEMPPDDLDVIGVKMMFSLSDGIKTEPLGTKNDPSTIYFPLPIIIPEDISNVPAPPRYPKYYSLTPEQKFIYLTWLQNIDSTIHEGYRHLFFFGLERQLLLGNFDAAFDMILRLRNGAKEPFDHFILFHITDTLFTACLMKNRMDLYNKMRYIFDDPWWRDMHIWIKYYINEPVEPEEIIKILLCQKVNGLYFEKAPEIYKEELSKILDEKTGHSYINLTDYISADNCRLPYEILGFHNSSFPFEFRNTEKIPLPNPDGLIDFLIRIHSECHERIKTRLRKLRSKH